MLLDDSGGAPEAGLDDAEPDDLLVAITFAPFSRTTYLLAQRAAAAGARVIAISDTARAPVRQFAVDSFFLAPTLSRAFPESVGGALAIVNLLAALALAKLGDSAQERVRENERRLLNSGEYLTAGRRSKPERARPADSSSTSTS
jgi:DNA-binding MurR/RpiR family transcriptional regulator